MGVLQSGPGPTVPRTKVSIRSSGAVFRTLGKKRGISQSG
jgi:hypothetical protein